MPGGKQYAGAAYGTRITTVTAPMRIADAAAKVIFCLVSLSVASGAQHGAGRLGDIPHPRALLIPSPAPSDTQVRSGHAPNNEREIITPAHDQQDGTTQLTYTTPPGVTFLRDRTVRHVPIVWLSRPPSSTTAQPVEDEQGHAPGRSYSLPPQDDVTSSFFTTSNAMPVTEAPTATPFDQPQDDVELNLVPVKKQSHEWTFGDRDNELPDSLSDSLVDRVRALARPPQTFSSIHALSGTSPSAAVPATTDRQIGSSPLPPNQRHRDVEFISGEFVPADGSDDGHSRITTIDKGIFHVVKKNEAHDGIKRSQSVVSPETVQTQASTPDAKSESHSRFPEGTLTSTTVPREVTGSYTTGSSLASIDVLPDSHVTEGIKRPKKSGTDKEYATTHAVVLETTQTEQSQEAIPSKGGTVYKRPSTDVTTVKFAKAGNAGTEYPTSFQGTETSAKLSNNVTEPETTSGDQRTVVETVSTLPSPATADVTPPPSDTTTSQELSVEATDKGDEDFELHPPEGKEALKTTVLHETAPPLDSQINGLPVLPTAPLEPRGEPDVFTKPRRQKPEAEGASITESRKEVDPMTTEWSSSTGAEKRESSVRTTATTTTPLTPSHPLTTDGSSKRTSEAGFTTTPQGGATIGVLQESANASTSTTNGTASEGTETVGCLLLETGCGSPTSDRTPTRNDGARFSHAEPHQQPPHPDVSFCITVTLSDTWDRFCRQVEQFRHSVAALLSSELRPQVEPHQVVIEDRCDQAGLHRDNDTVVVRMHLTDTRRRYSQKLTALAAVILHHHDRQHINMQMMNVCFYSKQSTLLTRQPVSLEGMSSTGVIASITISAVAGTSLFLICILLVIMRQRLHSKRGTPATADALSLASFKSSFRKKKIRQSLRSFLNEAFDDNDEFSKPVPFNGLPAAVSNKDALEEEFKRIPMNMPRVDDVPQGVERKNRYANVIPIPETRVSLSSRPDDETSDYINANFVRGYKGRPQRYIACQAPLPDTIEDFWRMIWEQQCKVILMLTACEENGVQRCASYFPLNTLDCHKLYGDYQVTLVSKDVRPSFTISTFKLHHLDKNLCREVYHCWYTAWPVQGVPEDVSSVVLFLLEARQHTSRSPSPVVVHCSPGTGRTGTVLAIDVCMQELEDKHRVDVPRTVLRLRQDRGGAVQTKDQYAFIYEALYDYSARLAAQSQRPSVISAT